MLDVAKYSGVIGLAGSLNDIRLEYSIKEDLQGIVGLTKVNGSTNHPDGENYPFNRMEDFSHTRLIKILFLDETLKFRISSTGLYIPPKVETSADISSLIGKSENWIIEKSGKRTKKSPRLMLMKWVQLQGKKLYMKGNLIQSLMPLVYQNKPSQIPQCFTKKKWG